MTWQLDGKTLSSRLLLGSAQYPSPAIFSESLSAAAVDIVTVSVRRETAGATYDHNVFFQMIQQSGCHVLPNTAGCKTVRDAIFTAQLARELWQTHWIKLEVIGDDYTLQPDPFALLTAAKTLVQEGFMVLPYCTEDLILCQRLVEVGCTVLMPWAAPIGSNQGLLNPFALQTLRARLPNITLIIDAGIGAPSHAARAMEMGFDAVLLNTAVALARDPVLMAKSFSQAVQSGRGAYEAGLVPARNTARASTPVVGQPIWNQ